MERFELSLLFFGYGLGLIDSSEFGRAIICLAIGLFIIIVQFGYQVHQNRCAYYKKKVKSK